MSDINVLGGYMESKKKKTAQKEKRLIYYI